MIYNFNEKPNFPYTYGDETADQVRLSDYVVELMKNKKFQNYIIAVFVSVVVLGSYASTSRAIPPEYGEAANNVVEQMEQDIPPIGNGQIANNIDGAGRVDFNARPQNPRLPQGQGIAKPGAEQVVPTPGDPTPAPVIFPVIPPQAMCQRIVHSKPWAYSGLLSLGWVCFTAYVTKDRGLAGVCAGLFFYAIGKK